MLGVVKDTPEAVFKVTATNQLVRSEYALQGPFSCSWKEKSQFVPRWIVDEVWTATITLLGIGTSNFARCHSSRKLELRLRATP